MTVTVRRPRRGPGWAPGLLAPAISALTLSLWSAGAEAKTTIAGDLDYAAGIDSVAHHGWGFGIRLGQQIHVPLVVLNPELGFDYHAFSDDSSPKVYRGVGGLRIGIGEILRPGAFVHVGIGRATLARPDLGQTAFTYDAGLFLDFTALPLLDVGVHVAYDRIAAGDQMSRLQFVTAGVHAALVF